MEDYLKFYLKYRRQL